MKTVKLFTSALIMLTALALVACTDDPVNPDPKDKAEYTIIYYANGGANVDQCVLPMIEDFYKASADAFKKVNVVVQYKFSTADNLKAQHDNEDHEPYADRFDDNYRQYFGSRSVRWAIDPTKTMDEQMKDPVSLYGEVNADCTCPDSLVNFINWAVETYPAKKYMLIMNDHGHGYRPDEDLPEAKMSVTKGMIFDDGHLLADGTRKHFSVTNFTHAIRSVNVRFETIYLLACLMNNLEYQFEMKDLCDYTIASTYTMPAAGGALNVLVEQFSQSSVDVEKALSTYCRADVTSWDEAWGIDENKPAYTDLTVTRTAALDNLGDAMREFTDRLCDTYQNGTAEQKHKIDDCTAEAVKIHMDNPYYDVAKYMESLMQALPEVYDADFYRKMKDSFNGALVSQHFSKYLEYHHYQVDYSIILGVEGSYSVLSWQNNDQGNTWTLLSRKRYLPDGNTEIYNFTQGNGENVYSEQFATAGDPWGSTLSDTFEKLAFDRSVGWSRWLRLNKKEPSLFCPSGQYFVLPDGDTSHNPHLF